MKYLSKLEWTNQSPERVRVGENAFVLVCGRADEDGVADALYVAQENADTVSISWTQAYNDWDDEPVSDDSAQELTTAESPTITVPMSQVPQLAEAFLYVHRRTHEHDYEGADAGV